MINEVWTQGSEMKHYQWIVDWQIWDETWTVTVKCGLKEIMWNMNNEVDNVTTYIRQRCIEYAALKLAIKLFGVLMNSVVIHIGRLPLTVGN